MMNVSVHGTRAISEMKITNVTYEIHKAVFGIHNLLCHTGIRLCPKQTNASVKLSKNHIEENSIICSSENSTDFEIVC